MMEKSEFSDIKPVEPVETFDLMRQFAQDDAQNKVSLIMGAYRDDDGNPWVLPVVRRAEEDLIKDKTLNKEYLPILGLETFSSAATKIILGEDSPAIKENRAFGVQTLSGTGALRIGAEFLAKTANKQIYYMSNPTYANHPVIFTRTGFLIRKEYRYWDEKTKSIDIAGLLQDLSEAPKGSVIILHGCAHNPTGMDPTRRQWEMIADVMKEKELFPFFDCAYQGFATGDLDRDAWPVRMFVERGFELICAQSFAKSFGLYNERIGNMVMVLRDKSLIPVIKSHLTIITRSLYTSPPNHGARIVMHVLNNPKLVEEWKENMKTMSSRMANMRKRLRENLEKLQTPGDWSAITEQIGMFSYMGLNANQCKEMKTKHHVYILSSGRLSICGLTPKNVDYVARAIHDVVVNNK